VALTFRAADRCEGGRVCNVFTLAPGESYPWDLSDCVGPDFVGTAYIHSTEPIAVAGDTVGREILRSWSAFPSASPYDLDNDGRVDEDDFTVFNQALGSTPGTANWNPRADLDHDLAVNWSDRVLFEQAGLCREVETPTPTPGLPTPTIPPTATATPTSRPPGPIFLPIAHRPPRSPDS
jgi:hypothetical protein